MEKIECCKLCLFEAPFGDELDKHILESHQNIFRKDPENSKNDGKVDPKLICKSEVRINGYTCSYCNFKATTKQMLGFHIRKSHILFKFLGKSKPKNSEEKKTQTFICTDCKFQTSNSDTLLDHVQKTHRRPNLSERSKMFECNVCEYSSKKAYNLHRHYNKVHLMEKSEEMKSSKKQEDTNSNSRATDEPSAQPAASAISGGGDGLWERYFCEVCNFNSDKFVDVERHKQNVHAKQQQTDFATYVTRTLLRSLDTFPVAKKSENKAGKAQKKKKQPNSPIACSPVKNAEKLISTKKSSKKVVDETVVVAESKPTVAVAAVVKSPQQQNSPNKTSHCDAKVTSESDFASYVTRTLLKGLANETPTSSKIMKETKPKKKDPKETQKVKESKKETKNKSYTDLSESEADEDPKRRNKISSKIKEDSRLDHELVIKVEPQSSIKSKKEMTLLSSDSEEETQISKRSKKVEKEKVSKSVEISKSSHRINNGNYLEEHHEIVPEQNDFASYVTRRLLKNLSDDSKDVTPSKNVTSNKNVTPNKEVSKKKVKEEKMDGDSTAKSDLKTATTTTSKKVRESTPVKNTDDFSSDSDTDKYTLKKMTKAVSKKVVKRSPVKHPMTDMNNVVVAAQDVGKSKRKNEDENEWKKKAKKTEESYRETEPLRLPDPVNHRPEELSSDSDTDKYALKQMTKKAIVNKPKAKHVAPLLQGVSEVDTSDLELKKTGRKKKIVKASKTQTKSNKMDRRKSEPTVNRFLDNHSSDEDDLDGGGHLAEVVKKEAKGRGGKKAIRSLTDKKNFQTIDQRFDSLFGQDLPSEDEAVEVSISANDLWQRFSSESSDSEHQDDDDDDDEKPISVLVKSTKKMSKKSATKGKSKQVVKSKSVKRSSNVKSYHESSDNESDASRHSDDVKRHNDNVKCYSSHKISTSIEQDHHEQHTSQNDYANYVTRTLLKSITVTPQTSQTSQTDSKSGERKDFSKKKKVPKDEKTKKVKKKEKSLSWDESSGDEREDLSNREDCASYVTRKLVNSLSTTTTTTPTTTSTTTKETGKHGDKKQGQKRKSSTTKKPEKSPAAKKPQNSLPESLPAPFTSRTNDNSKTEEDIYNGDFAVYVTRRLVKSLPN